MHEREKLEEAKFFLQRMEGSAAVPEEFKYHLSAFLTAARTVLQYAFREAEAKADGRAWYEGLVTGNTVLRWFRDLRDVQIHERPVQPDGLTAVSLVEPVSMSEGLRIVKIDEVGERETIHTSEDPPVSPKEIPPEVRHIYQFQGWPGSEDVITLAKQYLVALEAVVADGVARGFLTP